jgi:hypothetical protein
MVKTIGNLVSGALGLMAISGVLCVMVAVIAGNTHSF